MKFCRQCGTQFPGSATFCGNCGIRLPDEPRPEPKAFAPPPPPSAPTIAAPMPDVRRPYTEPPVPVASHAFRPSGDPDEGDEQIGYTSALPWEQEGRDDLVAPPASAYADDPQPEFEPRSSIDLEPLPPPPPPAPPPSSTPTYDSYVVDERPPPHGDPLEVPNAPPERFAAAGAGPAKKRPNWIMRHKLITATAAVISAVIIAAAVNSTGDPGTSTTTPPASGAFDGQTTQLAGVGQPVTLTGITTTVTSVTPQDAVDQTHTEGYLVVDVTMTNTSEQSKPYNSLDWKLQTPEGTTVTSESIAADGQLTSGEIPASGTVTGKIAFKIGQQRGAFNVLWKPDPVDPAQGIWTVNAA